MITLVELASKQSWANGNKIHVRLYVSFSGRAIACRINARNNRTLYGVSGTAIVCRSDARNRALYGIKFECFDHYSDLVLNAYLIMHEHQLPRKRNNDRNTQI